MTTLLSGYGTGSYPEPPQGLQRKIRQMARPRPLMGPCFKMAWRAYSEQVGVKRHDGPSRGDIYNW